MRNGFPGATTIFCSFQLHVLDQIFEPIRRCARKTLIDRIQQTNQVLLLLLFQFFVILFFLGFFSYTLFFLRSIFWTNFAHLCVESKLY